MVLARLLHKLRGRISDSLSSGTVVGGFRILKRIGSGAWSTIYEAESVSTKQRFALKQTHIAELDEREKQAVVDELRLLASLHHPNILQYNASFVEGGDVFLVMDLVKGGDLAGVLEAYVEREQRMPESQVWTYLLQATRALEHMHSHSVIHRDIKPANFLLDSNGLLKVADLGVAGVLEADMCVRQQIGTAGFMAPELYRRECQTFAADIFSLGMCLFEMCALRSRFVGMSEAQIDAAVAAWSRADAAAAASTLLSGPYSDELVRLLEAMLQPDPAARPTAAQVLKRHGTPERLARLPAPPPRDSCGRSWEDAQGAAVPLLPRIPVPADLQQLNQQLPPPCCSRVEVPRG